MGDLSKNFTRAELITCRTHTYNNTKLAPKGTKIDNTPVDFKGVKAVQIEKNLDNLCDRVLQPARDYACIKYKTIVYVRVSSGYRCPIYNADVGGDDASEHLYGMAADVTMYYFDSKGNKVWLTNDEMVAIFKEAKIPYKQMLDERIWRFNGKEWYLDTWMHVSTPFGDAPATLVHKESRNTKENTKIVHTVVKAGTW